MAGQGVVPGWLKSSDLHSLCIVADIFFAEHDILRSLECPISFISREPRTVDVLQAASHLAAAQPDTVLALGGGSTIDAAKAICAQLRYGTLDIRDRTRDARAPRLIAAPTTAGSGSEASRFFIVSDTSTGVKTAMRSWALVPDLTLLDPDLIAHSSPQRLVLGAFDAAIHLWETMLAKGERSAFTDSIAQSFLPRILSLLPAMTNGAQLSDAERLDLMQASAMAGIAISNVRTGLLHTLGESLAAQTGLAHPMTLKVFLRPALESYASAISAQTRTLWSIADALAPAAAPWTLETFITAWEQAFLQTGLSKLIAEQMASCSPSLDLLCDVASRDTTLAKENPVPIDRDGLRQVAKAGLDAVNPR